MSMDYLLESFLKAAWLKNHCNAQLL